VTVTCVWPDVGGLGGGAGNPPCTVEALPDPYTELVLAGYGLPEDLMEMAPPPQQTRSCGRGGASSTGDWCPPGDACNQGSGVGINAGNADVCIDPSSLNLFQKAQLFAAQTYAKLTGWTFGFGAGADAGAGLGPKSSSWNVGVGGSASTLIVADGSGNAGFLNSISAGFSGVKMKAAGSIWGAGFAAGPSVLVSPFSINTIKGPSGSLSGGGGAVLGAGGSISTSGAATLSFGVGAGAVASASPQGGTSKFIPFCHK